MIDSRMKNWKIHHVNVAKNLMERVVKKGNIVVSYEPDSIYPFLISDDDDCENHIVIEHESDILYIYNQLGTIAAEIIQRRADEKK